MERAAPMSCDDADDPVGVCVRSGAFLEDRADRDPRVFKCTFCIFFPLGTVATELKKPRPILFMTHTK